MRRLPGVLSVVAVGIFATGTTAQERADFSGAWTSGPARATRGGQGGGAPSGSLGSGWGQEFTITQDMHGLSVERVFFSPGDLQPSLKFHYSLEGSETRNAVLMGRGLQEQVSKTAWQGDKLVITTLHSFVNPEDGQPMTSEVRRTLSLQPSRSPAWRPSLVIETMRSGVLGGAGSVTRTVYARR